MLGRAFVVPESVLQYQTWDWETQVLVMPVLYIGHQIRHFLPLGLNFLIHELGTVRSEG